MLTISYVIETDIEKPYTNGNNKDECVSLFRHTKLFLLCDSYYIH